MKTDKEIKERISLIDDMIFHLENLMTKDENKCRKNDYSETIQAMLEQKYILKWVLNGL